MNETAPYFGCGNTSDKKLFLKILLLFYFRTAARGKGKPFPLPSHSPFRLFSQEGKGMRKERRRERELERKWGKSGIGRGKRSGIVNGNENGMGLRKRSVKGGGKMVRNGFQVGLWSLQGFPVQNVFFIIIFSTISGIIDIHT